MIRCFQWLSLGLLIALTACQQMGISSQNELDSVDYQTAKQRLKEGDMDGALTGFLRVIDQLNAAPESHLEAGVIYLRHRNQPIRAIYHFQRYLEYNPENRESPLVQELIMSAEKRFITQLHGDPFKERLERLDIIETVAKLREDNERMGAELTQLKTQNAHLKEDLGKAQQLLGQVFEEETGEVVSGPDTRVVASTNVTTQNQEDIQTLLESSTNTNLVTQYKVVPGDTLYAISIKMYGDASHIQRIFQNNRQILSSVDDLRPGQILTIPR